MNIFFVVSTFSESAYKNAYRAAACRTAATFVRIRVFFEMNILTMALIQPNSP